MTRLHPDDIEAIAAAIVRKQREQENISLDQDYLISLPFDEQQRRIKAKFAASRPKRQARKQPAA